MLTLSRRPAAVATLEPIAEALTPGLEEAASGSTHVWPLRPEWESIVRAALDLGAVAVTLGDRLCGLTQHGRVRWHEPDSQGLLAAGEACVGADLSRWACGLATQCRLVGGELRRGLLFFGAQGHVVLRIEVGAGVCSDAYHGLVLRHVIGMPASAGATDAIPADAPSSVDAPVAMWARTDHERATLHALQRPADAALTLGRLAAEGLAEPLASDALLEVLRHAAQTDLALRVSVWYRGTRADWAGGLHHLGCVDGQAIAQGAGLGLHWREDLPGQQAWLLRSTAARGLSQSLLLFAPDGALRMRLAPMGGGSRPEPCAWRNAIETVRGGCAGRAC